ncbi:MAG: hypothetical protein AAFX90_07465 [Pseudomonadota bacterium]
MNWSTVRRIRSGTCVAFAAVALVSACGTITKSSDRVQFEGNFFRAKAKPVDKKKAPTDFTVVVNGVSQSLNGAREAGRYEGTKYCIEQFGSSRIEWKVGPDTEPDQLQISDDKLSFAGTCQRP